MRIIKFLLISLFLVFLTLPAAAQTSSTSETSGDIKKTTTSEKKSSSEVVDEEAQDLPKPEVADPLVGESSDKEGEGISSGSQYSQPKFEKQEILWDKVDEAKANFEVHNKTYLDAVDIVRDLRNAQKTYDYQIDNLDKRSKELIATAEEIEESIESRALADFMIKKQVFESGPVTGGATVKEQVEKQNMESLLEIDQQDVKFHKTISSRLNKKSKVLINKSKKLNEAIRAAEDVAANYKIVSDQAEIEYLAYKAGSAVYVEGVVFPIATDYSTPIIDSYGFPRMPNTPDAHWHEGIDLFAVSGAPLVAAESGTLFNLGSGRLGGIKLWIKGDSGVEWYYAHLKSFAPGVHEGQRVEAGEVIGYVGNTGNAVGTPPHVHLEMHPNGAGPINPYPLLSMVVNKNSLENNLDIVNNNESDAD